MHGSSSFLTFARTTIFAAPLFSLILQSARAQTWSVSRTEEVHDVSAERCAPNPCPAESRSSTRTDAYTLPGGSRHHLKLTRIGLTDNVANLANVNCSGNPFPWCADSSSTSGFVDIGSRRIELRHGKTNPVATELKADARACTASSASVVTVATGTGRIISLRGAANGTPIPAAISWTLTANRRLEAACPSPGTAFARLGVHLSLNAIGASPAAVNPLGSVSGDLNSLSIDETQFCNGTTQGVVVLSCQIPAGARIGDRYEWAVRVINEVAAELSADLGGINVAKAMFDGKIVASTLPIVGGTDAIFDLDVPDDCDSGNVNIGAGGTGEPFDSLTVNGSSGEDSTVTVTAGQPATVSILSPPAIAGNRHWVLWIYDGTSSTPTNVQARINGVVRNLGTACRCMPASNTVVPNSCACPTALLPQPRGVSSKSFAGPTVAGRFCLPQFAGASAYPATFSVTFPRGTYTLVGLIQDGASPNTIPMSVMNQVKVVAP